MRGVRDTEPALFGMRERCGVCSEWFFSRCMLSAGHDGQHVMGAVEFINEYEEDDAQRFNDRRRDA
jgi:hypothetical protein